MSTTNEEDWFTCEQPRLVRNKYTGQMVQVNCGQCPACVTRRNHKYVPLIFNESAFHKYTYFVTLTYNDKHLPIIKAYDYIPKNPLAGNWRYYSRLLRESEEFVRFKKGLLPVCKSVDVQKFLKRLRKCVDSDENISLYGRRKIRYFFHYDYGSTTFRPHWHGVLFFDSDDIAENIEDYVRSAWSFNAESLGFIDCQRAISAAAYVALYTQTISKLPPIYSFRDFAPRALFSQRFGHCFKFLQDVGDIVRRGLREVVVYDYESVSYKTIPLPASYIYRYFPRIPSFSSLTDAECLEVYRICYRVSSVPNLEKSQRDNYLLDLLETNTFWNNYITHGARLTYQQGVDKFDRVFYAFKRLLRASLELNIPLIDYHSYLRNFDNVTQINSLSKQLSYENRMSENGYSAEQIASTIDLSKTFDETLSPLELQPTYFRDKLQLKNKQIKRKLNNAYLELHPEYKQFHN